MALRSGSFFLKGYKFRYLSQYDTLVLAYLLFGEIVAYRFNFEISYSLLLDFSYDLYYLGIFAAVALVYSMIVAGEAREKGRPVSFWRPLFTLGPSAGQALYDVFHVLLLMKVVLLVYCCIKQAIPRVHPFLYDPGFAEFDTEMHFGANPVVVTSRLLSTSPLFARAIDAVYVFWYGLKAAILPFFIFTRRPMHEAFFSAYFAVWIFGGLLAVILPTVGPVYMNPEWFASLSTPIAHTLQQRLWGDYQMILTNPEGYRPLIYEGVAAFPSLHVACVVLYAFFLRLEHPRLARGAWAIVVLTFFGSMALGWHYAVDGYIGGLIAFLCYFVCMLNVPPALRRKREQGFEPPTELVERVPSEATTVEHAAAGEN